MVSSMAGLCAVMMSTSHLPAHLKHASAEFPRFVNHVDDNFLKQVTQLYKERIPDGGAVLDLMSSHVSHLPRDKKYSNVIGHGMNAQEVRTLSLPDIDSSTWSMKLAAVCDAKK